MRLFQCDAIDLYRLVEEDGGVLTKNVGRLGGEESASAMLGTKAIHLRMAAHIVGEATTYIVALHNDLDVLGCVVAYLIVEDGVVCATEDKGVYLVVLSEQVVDMAADKVVCPFALRLTILN